MRELEAQWELRGEVGRRELRPRLLAFVDEYAHDPSSARARLLLAKIAIAERRLGRAEEILSPVLAGPEGSTKDEAHVVYAALLNRQGSSERALSILAPLQGKLLNISAREQFAKERILAALAMRRWRLAVDSMVSWLADEEGDTSDNRVWIQRSLQKVPSRALSRMLGDVVAPSESGAPADKWLRRRIVDQLAQSALQGRDPLLARDLLENAPAWLRATAWGDELGLLAALAQSEAQVIGRAVGLVVGGANPVQRRRSLRVAAGLLAGLGIAQPAGAEAVATDHSGQESPRIVATEDRGSLQAALGSLSGLGASVVVAGVDPAGATIALSYAEAQRIPTVVMSQPALAGPPLEFGFVFGSSAGSEMLAMEAALEPGAKWRFVGSRTTPCPALLSESATLPWGMWKEQGIDAIGVLGDSNCLRRVWRMTQAIGYSPIFAAGLEAAPGPFPHPEIFRLSSGEFPAAELVRQDALSQTERELAAGNPAPPVSPSDWYFSMGRDVAQLVWQALRQLPENAAADKAAVTARHSLARDALRVAKAPLWTTAAKGFAGGNRIERKLVLSLPGSEKASD